MNSILKCAGAPSCMKYKCSKLLAHKYTLAAFVSRTQQLLILQKEEGPGAPNKEISPHTYIQDWFRAVSMVIWGLVTSQ
jgi:hypothetical protein